MRTSNAVPPRPSPPAPLQPCNMHAPRPAAKYPLAGHCRWALSLVPRSTICTSPLPPGLPPLCPLATAMRAVTALALGCLLAKGRRLYVTHTRAIQAGTDRRAPPHPHNPSPPRPWPPPAPSAPPAAAQWWPRCAPAARQPGRQPGRHREDGGEAGGWVSIRAEGFAKAAAAPPCRTFPSFRVRPRRWAPVSPGRELAVGRLLPPPPRKRT